MTCQSIADEIGCSRSTVFKYFRIHGIESIAPGQNRIRKRGLGYDVKCEGFHKRELQNIQEMENEFTPKLGERFNKAAEAKERKQHESLTD